MLYQSIRKAGVSSFLSMLRSGLLLIPSLLITTHFFGLYGVMISQPIADVIAGLVSVIFVLYFIMVLCV
jgi:hypothetical protein